MLWGYPDDVHYDLMADSGGLVVDLVYSAGHIRRCVNYGLPDNRIPGRNFYELSSPAGQCCSGAPMSIRKRGGEFSVVGVYVGEHRDFANTFAVGYATRTEALVAQCRSYSTEAPTCQHSAGRDIGVGLKNRPVSLIDCGRHRDLDRDVSSAISHLSQKR